MPIFEFSLARPQFPVVLFFHARSPFLLTLQSQLNEAATEVEMYLYVAQSFRAFEQALHAKTKDQSTMARENLCEAASGATPDSVRRPEKVLRPGEVSDAIGTMVGTVSGIDFEPLQEAVDRSVERRGTNVFGYTGNIRTCG